MKCVQCSLCNKWRTLDEGIDLETFENDWNCSLNPDEAYQSCDIEEESYEDGDYVESSIGCGSVVWAKQTGHIFWPAIICADPSNSLWYKKGKQGKRRVLHVGFLGERQGRAWVFESRVFSYVNWNPLTQANPSMIAKMKLSWESAKFGIAKSWANELIELEDTEDRLEHCGFSLNFLQDEQASDEKSDKMGRKKLKENNCNVEKIKKPLKKIKPTLPSNPLHFDDVIEAVAIGQGGQDQPPCNSEEAIQATILHAFNKAERLAKKRQAPVFSAIVDQIDDVLIRFPGEERLHVSKHKSTVPLKKMKVPSSSPKKSKSLSSGPKEPKALSSSPKEPKALSSSPKEPKALSSSPKEPKALSSNPIKPKSQSPNSKDATTRSPENLGVKLSICLEENVKSQNLKKGPFKAFKDPFRKVLPQIQAFNEALQKFNANANED